MTSISQYSALLDANVLYPAPIRDILLQLARDDMYRARWTNAIQLEWIEALLRNEPWRDRDRLERTRKRMDSETRNALIYGYEDLIQGLKLPDPNDRHVLAAAIVGNCNVIVTWNLKHFPNQEIGIFGIEAQSPDEFLVNHLDLVPQRFCASVRKIRLRLKNPPFTAEEYLSNLITSGLDVTVAELRQYTRLLE